VILTVTLNAALDVTYAVDALVPHRTHRVRDVAEHAGGKGVNVARLLHVLGEPVLATGLVGGHTGERIVDLLAAEGVPAAFGEIAATSRRTVVVNSDGEATGFWEPGPLVDNAEWLAFTDRFERLLADADVVVLSGSLPRGVPATAYAELVTAARQAGVPVVLDADGEPLWHGLAAGPSVVKPNSDELASVVGNRPSGLAEAASAAARLREAGAEVVVASLGSDGLVAVTGEGVWHAAVPPQSGNPTGAGDAVAAALARGLAPAHHRPATTAPDTGEMPRATPPPGTARPEGGEPATVCGQFAVSGEVREQFGYKPRVVWPEVVADAAALSGAAVLAPVAGAVDLATYEWLRRQVTVVRIDPAGGGG
jgi:tagatose 6-phosphate kinase